MNGEPVFDAGLQPERTLLAWHRTCLALAVSAAVATRLTVGTLGTASVALGLVGVVAAVAAGLVETRRYRHLSRQLVAGSLHTAGGLPIALLALAAAVVAAAGLAATFLFASETP